MARDIPECLTIPRRLFLERISRQIVRTPFVHPIDAKTFPLDITLPPIVARYWKCTKREGVEVFGNMIEKCLLIDWLVFFALAL